MTDRPGGHDLGTGGTWTTSHERARTLLAERMFEPLLSSDTGWLERHLLDCADCRLVETEYQSSREALRALPPAIPPRDLWARTSAALDREERRARRPWAAPVAGLARSLGRTSRAPMSAAIVAVVVVAFVAGSVLLPGRSTPPVAIASGGSGSGPIAATPIAVGAGDVVWFTASGDGSYVINHSPVEQVCPASAATPCATIETTGSDVALNAVAPRSVYGSPIRDQVVVLGKKAGSSGLTMFVMSVVSAPRPSATPKTPSRTPSPTPSATVTPGSDASATPTVEPVSPSPSTGQVSPSPEVSRTPEVSPTSTVPPPSETPGLNPSPTPSIIPGETPVPTAAAVLAIASDLVIVGQTAAYSPDGTWFAFNARSESASSGSDIYLWRAGDLTAKPITTDGHSVFSGWVGDRLIGSRVDTALASASPIPSGDAALLPPGPSDPASSGSAPSPTEAVVSDASASAATPEPPATPGELTTTSFLLDPATGAVVPLAEHAWRPVVDPSGRLVAYWDGTVVADPVTGGWTGGTGRLVVGSWPVVAGAAMTGPTPGASGATDSPVASETAGSSPSVPADSATPASPAVDVASPSGSASAAPSAAPVEIPAGVGSAMGTSWDAGWDETGEHLAIWIGDPADGTSGHISLLSVDPATGQAATTGPSLLANPALPGFSLSDGHLAWATPPDASGSGSRLQVFAWSGPSAGRIESQPAGATDTVIVVQH